MKTAFAQEQADSQFVSQLKQNLVNDYLQQLGDKAPIYNGKIYRPVLNLDEHGHTLFLNNQYTKGVITYNGRIYENVNIMYDLVGDQLILLNPDKTGGLIVWPEYVQAFVIHEHDFIHLKEEEIPAHSVVTPGYYDVLYQGKLNLLAKRTKSITETPTPNKIKRTVSQQDKYYLSDGLSFRMIKSKKDLLKALSKTGNQNQQYIKAEHLNYKKDKEQFMVRLLAFYESLK